MDMTITTLDDGITKVDLVGRLDIEGAMKIDLHFSVVAGSQRKVIVDLEQVAFLASMGIRTLLIGAKAVKSKGGRMVLLRPSATVEEVLVTSGIPTLIPIAYDLESAIGSLSA